MTDLATHDDAETVAIEATRDGGPVDPPAPPSTTFADITSDRHVRPIVPASLRSAAGRRALAVLIESEMVEPTKPWPDLLPTLALRARNLAEQAEGR